MNPAVSSATFFRRHAVIKAWRNECHSLPLIEQVTTEEHANELVQSVVRPSSESYSDSSRVRSSSAKVPACRELKRKRGAAILQELDSNIASMASKPSTPTPEKRTRRSQARKGRKSAVDGEGETEDDKQEEITPRPRRSRATQSKVAAANAAKDDSRGKSATETGLWEGSADGERGQSNPRAASAYTSTLADGFIPAIGPESRSQSSTGNSSRRSKSPVKQMADLRLANKPIVDVMFGNNLSQLPLDIRETYKQLKILSDGEGVLPAAIKQEIEASAGDMEPFRAYMFDDQPVASAETRTQLLHDLDEVVEICNASRKCTQDCVAEPSWNDEVHSRILRLALRRIDGVEHQNIKTARPVHAVVPRHVSGDFFKSKMVDYAISLIPDKDMDLRIRQILQHEAPHLQTINQTMYGPVRYRPIAVSIETKTPDASEQDARMQLAMWEAAYFNRIRTLTHEVPTMITRPVLFASGSQWSTLFACDHPDIIRIFGKLLNGETTLFLGCYKIIAVIRYLCVWAKHDYKDWFMESVLGNLAE